MMRMFGVYARANFAAVLAVLMIAACGPAMAADATLHPDIKPTFDADPLDVVVKATSAAAMAKACPAQVRIKSLYAASLDYALKYNDTQYGAGASNRDIAVKIKEHKDENDCEPLTAALKKTFYSNVFLEPLK